MAALCTIHVSIVASKVMVIVFGIEILNVAQVVFPAVSVTSKI